MLICDSPGQSGLNEGGERECGSCERKRKQDNEIKKEITRSKRGMHAQGIGKLRDCNAEAVGKDAEEGKSKGNGNGK